MKRLIPWMLVMSRILLAPVAIWLAIAHFPKAVWMGQFAFAALTDWLDGKLARRWGSATPGLRQADSIADTVYVIAIAVSLWFSHPSIMYAHSWGIGLVIALELRRYPLDWWRFGRGASYHALSAKLFGISLLVAVSAIMVFDDAGPFLWIALFIGVVSEIEGIVISLVLPKWTHDVKSIRMALALRSRSLEGKFAAMDSGPVTSNPVCNGQLKFMDFHTVREQLISLGGTPGTPASQKLFESVERRYGVRLPADVKRNYLIMNGAETYTDASWMRFWPIEEWRPACTEFPNDHVASSLPEQMLICADYAIECVYYVIDLNNKSSTFGYVFGLGSTHSAIAAKTFSEFVMRVIQDSDELHTYG
jgi:CDP-diacylglycerol--glycerol-3-phosphate 3-phosphatidyltransferase